MNIKYIDMIDLKTDDLIKLYNNNDDLKRMIESRYIENEMYYLDDIIRDLDGLKDYSIGFYNNNYVSIDIFTIYIGIENIQENYCFFRDEDYNTLESLMYLSDIEARSEEEEEEEIERRKTLIENIILKSFNRITDIKDEYLIDFFTGYLIEDMEGYKIVANSNDYKIYKQVITILE